MARNLCVWVARMAKAWVLPVFDMSFTPLHTGDWVGLLTPRASERWGRGLSRATNAQAIHAHGLHTAVRTVLRSDNL
jgi:hypothetical protein